MSEWFEKYIEQEKRAERAEELLKQFAEGRDLLRAEHVRSLGEMVGKLRQQIRRMQVEAEDHNRNAYATGLIVRCTGCDAGKPLNGLELTEARVREVENISGRLRSWFNNHRHRKAVEAAKVV